MIVAVHSRAALGDSAVVTPGEPIRETGNQRPDHPFRWPN
jgi:hypothetical protein